MSQAHHKNEHTIATGSDGRDFQGKNIKQKSPDRKEYTLWIPLNDDAEGGTKPGGVTSRFAVEWTGALC